MTIDSLQAYLPKIITYSLLLLLLVIDVFVVYSAQGTFNYFDEFNKRKLLESNLPSRPLIQSSKVESVFDIVDNLVLYQDENFANLDSINKDPFGSDYDRDTFIDYLVEGTKQN